MIRFVLTLFALFGIACGEAAAGHVTFVRVGGQVVAVQEDGCAAPYQTASPFLTGSPYQTASPFLAGTQFTIRGGGYGGSQTVVVRDGFGRSVFRIRR